MNRININQLSNMSDFNNNNHNKYVDGSNDHAIVVTLEDRSNLKLVTCLSTYEPTSSTSSSSTSSTSSSLSSSSISGLESTVRELLQDYKPSSNERRPFWCRICMFQGKDVDDLSQHRNTELHKLASEKERKLSYCKLCRKQFTSPDQLRKHVQGKPHKDKLAYFANKQQSQSHMQRSW